MSTPDLAFAALDIIFLVFILAILKRFVVEVIEKPDFFYIFMSVMVGFLVFQLVNDLAAGFNYVMLGNFWLNFLLFLVGGWYVGFMYRRHYHAK